MSNPCSGLVCWSETSPVVKVHGKARGFLTPTLNPTRRIRNDTVVIIGCICRQLKGCHAEPLRQPCV
ncbi:MAG: hypothetical protein ACNA7V_15200, partial [Bacteroidales bacterium]